MSFMAERPTGALRNEEEPTLPDDGSVDTADMPDPDAAAPAGWTATHYAAGGGEAQDEAGNVVTVDADGTVQTFMAREVGVAGPAIPRSAAPVVPVDAPREVSLDDLDEEPG
jgi:hypothetical protein